MEQNDETTPLLASKIDEGKAEEGKPTETAESTEPSMFMMLLDPYEAVTKHTHTKLPAPLMLLGLCLGMAFVEILGIFGAYMFLVTHAHTLFPMCTQRDVVDDFLGAPSPHSYLCTGSSWLLWTFPLFCCGVIPFLQYWEFCDQRLFYECLREKILVKFPPKRFFTAPIIIIMGVWLLLGLTTLLFGGNPGKDWQGWVNMAMLIMPFMLPVLSFFVTVFLSWDIKFFLITLSNFADEDVDWAQRHLSQCVSVSDEDVMEAFERLREAGDMPIGGTSEQVFGTLKDELAKPESAPSMTHVDSDTKKWIATSMDRAMALILFREGFWLTDLLWMPQDKRAKMFRIMFRVFAAVVWLIVAVVAYLLTITTLLYMEKQGRLSEVPHSALWLRNFIIQTA